MYQWQCQLWCFQAISLNNSITEVDSAYKTYQRQPWVWRNLIASYLQYLRPVLMPFCSLHKRLGHLSLSLKVNVPNWTNTCMSTAACETFCGLLWMCIDERRSTRALTGSVWYARGFMQMRQLQPGGLPVCRVTTVLLAILRLWSARFWIWFPR